MIELTPRYILSQVFVFIVYTIMSTTFFMKRHKTILISNTVANGFFIIGFFLLNAYSGMAAVIIAMIRNLLSMVKKINEKAIMWLSIIALGIAGVYTYNGIFSTFILIATMLYSYSICQTNVRTYKILNIFVSLLRLTYNIFVFSIIGIAFEIGLFISAVVGVCVDKKGNE